MTLNEQVQNFDEDFDLPEEFANEPVEEEIIYDWDGGVLDETKQNA